MTSECEVSDVIVVELRHHSSGVIDVIIAGVSDVIIAELLTSW